MTKEEEREVIRVCGKDHKQTDIPSYIRERDKAEAEDRLENEGKKEDEKLLR